jgi:hypothetical protein
VAATGGRSRAWQSVPGFGFRCAWRCNWSRGHRRRPGFLLPSGGLPARPSPSVLFFLSALATRSSRPAGFVSLHEGSVLRDPPSYLGSAFQPERLTGLDRGWKIKLGPHLAPALERRPMQERVTVGQNFRVYVQPNYISFLLVLTTYVNQRIFFIFNLSRFSKNRSNQNFRQCTSDNVAHDIRLLPPYRTTLGVPAAMGYGGRGAANGRPVGPVPNAAAHGVRKP